MDLYLQSVEQCFIIPRSERVHAGPCAAVICLQTMHCSQEATCIDVLHTALSKFALQADTVVLILAGHHHQGQQ